MEAADRVRAALAMERADRVPRTWWGHTYREEWSPHDLAAVTIARQRTYGSNLVKLQPRASCFAEAFGSTYRPSDGFAKAPVCTDPAIKTPADWERLPAVDASTKPLADQIEALRLVVRELGDSVPVLQTVFSPFTVAGYLLGMDRDKVAVVKALREDSDLVGPALMRIGEGLADFAARSVEAGAAGIFYAISGYASDEVMSFEEYGVEALPQDRRIIEAVPSDAWCDVLHLCGASLHFDLVRELDVDVVSWSVHDAGNPSLVEGRDRSGRAVMGGLDRRTLLTGSAEEAIAEATDAETTTGGKGLILAPGCSVSPEAAEQNLRAISSIG